MDIKLSPKDKKHIGGVDDVFAIMQRILLRDNKIDQEKEHFWIIGLNEAGYILYIELVTLGTVRAAIIEPMNVYRVAVMKNATRIIGIHNHPSGELTPTEDDKDITDRLIQVGRILDIQMVDHLIISPTSYVSFAVMGLMDKLELSIKYVPTYQLIEKIRKEEKAIAKVAIQTAKEKAKAAIDAEKIAREQAKTLALALLEKGVEIENIAKILEVAPKEVERLLKKRR